jgi:gluconokinase
VSESARAPASAIIGIDVGTTAVKVVAFGLASGWRRRAVREYPLLEPEPGWQVQEPETVMAAVFSALAQVVEATAGAEITGLSVSTAMHGLLGLDSSMRPLTPLLTWADGRSVKEAQHLRDSGLAPDLQRTSGTPVHPMTPLTKLMWFQQHERRTAAAVRWWVGLKDYVLWRLTGTLVTELSSASGTGLLSLATRTWNPVALELAGVSSDQLAEVRPTTSTLPLSVTAAAQVGLRPGTPVVLGAADGPLGNLGTNAMSPGVVGLSLGTSGAVRMMVPRPPSALDSALFCYALTEDSWAVGGAISNGGIVARWAGSSLAPDLRGTSDRPSGNSAADERLLLLAGSVPAGSDGLVMLPYLLPERAPLWDPEVPGAYLGLRREHTRAHLARAAIEGVCLQLATIVDRLDALEPVTSVRATGGVFRSALWPQVLAGVLGRPVQVFGSAEGTALGAAALGLYALGHTPRLEDAPLLLIDPGSAEEATFRADAASIETYASVRAAIPRLIHALDDVAEIFRPVTAHRQQ